MFIVTVSSDWLLDRFVNLLATSVLSLSAVFPLSGYLELSVTTNVSGISETEAVMRVNSKSPFEEIVSGFTPDEGYTGCSVKLQGGEYPLHASSSPDAR